MSEQGLEVEKFFTNVPADVDALVILHPEEKRWRDEQVEVDVCWGSLLVRFLRKPTTKDLQEAVAFNEGSGCYERIPAFEDFARDGWKDLLVNGTGRKNIPFYPWSKVFMREDYWVMNDDLRGNIVLSRNV